MLDLLGETLNITTTDGKANLLITVGKIIIFLEMCEEALSISTSPKSRQQIYIMGL